MKRRALLLTGIGLTALLALGVAGERLFLVDQMGVLAGNKAPGFTARLLSDKEVHFPKDYAGKLVLLDFWATWCPPCRGELPHIREAHKKLPTDRFAVVSVSLDASRQRTPEFVKEFVQKENMAWDHVYDATSAVAEAYGVRGIPAPFLIDADTGEVVAMGEALFGPRMPETIAKFLEKKRK